MITGASSFAKIIGCLSLSCAALMAGADSANSDGPAADDAKVEFDAASGSLAISIGGEPFTTFVYEDDDITRPYFAHVKARGGIQTTRNHPPVEGQDSPDHATFHPGVWMSFGDINGSDYWRLAAPVKFERFTSDPKGGRGEGSFAARFRYQDQRDPQSIVCREDFRCKVCLIDDNRLIVWDSTFTSDKPFTFGDQEEMGLGFRVATAIRAERESEIKLPPGNGEIVSDTGAHNEEEIWGKTARWCDYRGQLQGKKVGMALFPHPKNFRPSWFHARDYGMIAANPFGRNAFGKGEKSAITVEPGEEFRLRYGVLVHAGPSDAEPDIAKAYQAYLELADD